MKNVVFFLIGNRDIQIKSNYLKFELSNKALAIINKYFVANNDGEDLVVNKAKNSGFTFLEASEVVFNSYEHLKEVLVFPMIESTLEHIQSTDNKLIFCSSKQSVPHPQDSWFFALLAENSFKERGFETASEIFTCNPNDFECLAEFFTTKFNSFIESEVVFISNSGGTPNMRAASHFAGIFKGFEYIHVNSYTKKATSLTFKKQEELVLKQIIEGMLLVYDYEGILSLPVSDEVKNIAKEAINLYNLKIDYISKKKKYDEKAKSAIELMYNNMYVCYKQGRYADVLGRIHRIEEAVGQFLFYEELQKMNAINDKDKVQRKSKGKLKFDDTFEKTIKNKHKKTSVLTTHFPDLFSFDSEKEKYFFEKFSTVPMDAGKNFYFFFFRSIEKHKEIYGFFEKLNNGYDLKDNKLTNLRNSSILGHGFDGVNLEMIEEVTGKFETFLSTLKHLVQKAMKSEINMFFDQINKKIISLL